jgi:hypothetical protein
LAVSVVEGKSGADNHRKLLSLQLVQADLCGRISPRHENGKSDCHHNGWEMLRRGAEHSSDAKMGRSVGRHD